MPPNHLEPLVAELIIFSVSLILLICMLAITPVI